MKDILQRVPPHDDQAEQTALCGILIRPDVMAEVLTACDPADFYRSENRLVFEAMVRLHCESTPIDPVTVADALRRTGDLPERVKESYLIELATQPIDVPFHAPAHARIVHELAQRRALMTAATEVAFAASDGEGSAADLIGRAQTAITEIAARQPRERPSTANVLRDTVAHLDDVAAEAVSTGFSGVDRALAGGFRPGELIVLAAPTSKGKSAFALNVAANIARNGGAALVLSLEMHERELARRLLYSEAQVEHPLGPGAISETARERIQHAADKFSRLKLAIEYRPSLTPMILRAVAQRFAREWGGIQLIVADYVGLMKPDAPQERREREVASITRELKLIAGELNCAILGVAQLNREISHREDGLPRLSDLRDSGAVEQDSDVVMFLAGLRDQPGVSLIIGKTRRGPLATVHLSFRASMTRFEDAA